MRTRLVALGVALTVAASAAPVGPRPGFGPRPPLGERPPRGQKQASENADIRAVARDLGSKEAPLLFCIGLHIEPFGSTVSSIVGGDRPRPPRANVEGGQRPRPPRAGVGGDEPLPPRQQRPGMGGGGQRPGGGQDYNDPEIFKMHVGSIQSLAAIIEQHGGKLTVQAQTPFTRVAAESGDSLLTDLQKRGHEIALHFHEDAHLGRNSENLPAATWAAVMREELDLIRRAVGREVRLRYWSGGNIFPGVLEAASAAGLDVMSDHKNPRKQETDPALLAIHPWRPAGGPGFDDVAAFVRHDPKGRIIYLPDGIFADADFHARKQGSDADYLNFLTDGLERSLRAARKDRVNVFHITVHPGELRGNPRAQFQVVAAWLTKVIDPLVAAGKVKWSSFSEMADAYIAWERANPEADPLGKGAAKAAAVPVATAPSPVATAAPAAGQGLSGPGYITFAVNVHDWCHPRESADTLKRLAGMFKRHGVKGDFYLTAPVVTTYREHCPDVIKTLKDTGMCISYHFRPPHPAYTGFSDRLASLNGAELDAALRDVETCELDLATGVINKDRKGGYALVAEVLGAQPVCVSALCDTPKIKMGLLKIYREMGARMALMYHESGTKVEQPFEFVEGLLVRPSDFSITRCKTPNEPSDNFWWNLVNRDSAADPTAMLKKELAHWKASRPPLITALIHENNYYRRGAETWKAFYLDGRTPLPPPWNLKAADPSRARPKQEVEKIFTAYENLLAYSAKHLKVVTSADLADLAR